VPDIGFLELLLIGVIAFLVLGPERMPELFGQVGRLVKKGRGWINDVRHQIDEETRINSTVAEIKDSLNQHDITDWNKEIMKQHGQVLPDGSSDNPEKGDKKELGEK